MCDKKRPVTVHVIGSISFSVDQADAKYELSFYRSGLTVIAANHGAVVSFKVGELRLFNLLASGEMRNGDILVAFDPLHEEYNNSPEMAIQYARNIRAAQNMSGSKKRVILAYSRPRLAGELALDKEGCLCTRSRFIENVYNGRGGYAGELFGGSQVEAIPLLSKALRVS